MESFIKCEICGRSFRVINENHLKLHGITRTQYHMKYPKALLITQELTVQLSKSVTKAFVSDPSLGERISYTLKETYKNDPSIIEGMTRKINQNYSTNPLIAQQISKTLMQTHKDNPQLGEQISAQLKKTYKENPSIAEGKSKAMKEVAKKDPTFGTRISEALKDTYRKNPEILEQMAERVSESMKQRWLDPEYQKHWTEGMGKERLAPNSSELELARILDYNFPDCFEFTGNQPGFKGVQPDFTDTLGKKIVVEMFGVHWHDPDRYPKRRSKEELITYYDSLGYKCLVFWENEVFCEERMIIDTVAQTLAERRIQKG